MNKVIFVSVLLFLFFDISAQDKLFLKNGEIETGKITAINRTVVRLHSDKAGRVKRFTERDIKKATMLVDGKDIEYTYENVPTLGRVLLGKLYSGRVSLYATELYIPGNVGSSGGPYVSGGQYPMYYLKKEGENSFFDANYDGVLFNKFHNRVSKYFKDCPALSKRIKTKLLTMRDLEEICEMYDTCSEL